MLEQCIRRNKCCFNTFSAILVASPNLLLYTMANGVTCSAVFDQKRTFWALHSIFTSGVPGAWDASSISRLDGPHFASPPLPFGRVLKIRKRILAFPLFLFLPPPPPPPQPMSSLRMSPSTLKESPRPAASPAPPRCVKAVKAQATGVKKQIQRKATARRMR